MWNLKISHFKLIHSLNLRFMYWFIFFFYFLHLLITWFHEFKITNFECSRFFAPIRLPPNKRSLIKLTKKFVKIRNLVLGIRKLFLKQFYDFFSWRFGDYFGYSWRDLSSNSYQSWTEKRVDSWPSEMCHRWFSVTRFDYNIACDYMTC